MTIRIAAVGVSHWHALNDAAYLRHLLAMPDVELVAIQDSDAGIVAKAGGRGGKPADLRRLRQDAGGDPPRFRPGARPAPADGGNRPRPARCRLSVPDGKADGDQRRRGRRGGGQGGTAQCVRRRAAGAALRAIRQARPRADRRRPFRAAVAHLCPHQPAGAGALSGLGLRLDARSGRGRRRLRAQPRPPRFRHVPAPDRRGGAGDRRPIEPARRTSRRSRTMRR